MQWQCLGVNLRRTKNFAVIRTHKIRNTQFLVQDGRTVYSTYKLMNRV